MTGQEFQREPASGRDTTSLSLLRRVKADDADAWRRLVDLYGPLIYYWCRRSGLTPSDTADVVQDVFRAVAAHIGRFRRDRPGDTFRGWLRTITRNKIRDHVRVQSREVRAPGGTDAHARLEELPEPAPDSDSVEPDDARAVADLLQRALDQIRCEFSEPTWRAFTLATLQERTSRDVAAELGMTANAVRKAKARVLRRLREQLGEMP